MIFPLHSPIASNVITLVIPVPDLTLIIARHVMLHGIESLMVLEDVYALIHFSMMDIVNYVLHAIILARLALDLMIIVQHVLLMRVLIERRLETNVHAINTSMIIY